MPVGRSIRHPARRVRGITLIEVLVAVLVLGIGLLGVASLQSRGLRMNMNSHVRGQATILAQDMLERMRANPDAFEAGDYDSSGGAGNAGDSGDYDTCNPDTAPGGGGCDPATMASSDLHAWSDALDDRLPQGEGVVCVDSTPEDGSRPSAGDAECDGAGDVYAVKVWWVDRNDEEQRFTTSADTL